MESCFYLIEVNKNSQARYEFRNNSGDCDYSEQDIYGVILVDLLTGSVDRTNLKDWIRYPKGRELNKFLEETPLNTDEKLLRDARVMISEYLNGESGRLPRGDHGQIVFWSDLER